MKERSYAKPMLALIVAFSIALAAIYYCGMPSQKKTTARTTIPASIEGISKSEPRQVIVIATDYWISNAFYEDPRLDANGDISDVTIVSNGEPSKTVSVSRHYLGDAWINFRLKGIPGKLCKCKITDTRSKKLRVYGFTLKISKKGFADISIFLSKANITTILMDTPTLKTLYQKV